MPDNIDPLNSSRIPAELHRRAKVLAARRGITLRAWIVEAIKRQVADEELRARLAQAGGDDGKDR